MTAATLRDDFLGLVREKRRLLDATATQMSGHRLERDAIDHFFESSFLEVVTRFESFVEDLFYEVALGQSSIYRTGPVGAVVGVRTREDLEAALLSSVQRDYLTWLPLSRTEERAMVVLRDGRPFSRLERRSSERSLLTEVTKIRNAIAHRSGDAWAKFEKLCPGNLPATRRTPAGLLRATVGVSTKYDFLCNGLGSIAGALAARSDSQAWRLLSPESERLAGKLAPAGTYQCVSCGSLTVLQAQATLPACVDCHTGPCLTCGVEQKSQFRRTAP